VTRFGGRSASQPHFIEERMMGWPAWFGYAAVLSSVITCSM
jgi:hypothetical protein